VTPIELRNGNATLSVVPTLRCHCHCRCHFNPPPPLTTPVLHLPKSKVLGRTQPLLVFYLSLLGSTASPAMSLPASASSRALRPALARLFTSSSAASAPADTPSTSKRPQARRQALGQFNIRYLEEFNFDDATSLGYLRLEKIRESQELVRKVELDREVLAGEQRLEQMHGEATQPIAGCR
jgi:hypothetical protein